MKLLLSISLLLLTGTLAFSQATALKTSSELPDQPVAFAQSLYTQVVKRHPSGIPMGSDWRVFSPYMSRSLLHRIDDFNKCVAEWDHRHQDPRYLEKAPFGIFESGMFSGGDERTEPKKFHIESVERRKDGSVSVHIKLSWWEEPVGQRDRWHTYKDKPYIWHISAILKQENGRFVVDDVIYLKDGDTPGTDYRLTQSLSYGCEGAHYVGVHTQ